MLVINEFGIRILFFLLILFVAIYSENRILVALSAVSDSLHFPPCIMFNLIIGAERRFGDTCLHFWGGAFLHDAVGLGREAIPSQLWDICPGTC